MEDKAGHTYFDFPLSGWSVPLFIVYVFLLFLDVLLLD